MLLLAPGPAGRGEAMPRDLTLVVDVSGSMSGTKLEQAKARCSRRWEPSARTTGSASSRSPAPCGPSGEQAGGRRRAANLSEAREFVDGLAAEGGTNLAGALEAALDQPG